MTTVGDLTAFLHAALDDDEQVAREALDAGRSARWASGAEGSVLGVEPGSEMHVRGAVLSIDSIGPHIARWDPARVLAEIDAKRRLIELHVPEPSGYVNGVYQMAPEPAGEPFCSHCANLCHSSSGIMCHNPDAPWPCPTVRLLALPYADHPGYRKEWRP